MARVFKTSTLSAMKRPSKKEIRAAVEGLKARKDGGSSEIVQNEPKVQDKKANKQRIRKKGV